MVTRSDKMKIAIDARGATWYHGTGIGTYTENIIRELLNLNTENHYLLYWSGKAKDYTEKENCNKIITSRKHHRFFQTHFFPKNLEKNKAHIYHVPQNGIGLTENIPCLKVATIHDLIPYIMPETVGPGYLKKFLKEMPQILQLCDGLLTVSEYSKRDILKFFPYIDEDKIFVTPLATNGNFSPLPKDKCRKYLKDNYGIDYKFIMYMGGFSDRKNVHSLIRSFSKIRSSLKKDVKLVILGSYRDKSQKLVKLCEELGVSKHVNFAGFIPEEDVSVFYNLCECFAYPSFYEGFGLPPLEAMSCGAPVVCSNTTSIPEVVSDSAHLIDPYSMDSISEGIFNVISSKSLQKELSEKGLKRSQDFSWENTALNTLNAYKRIYDNYKEE